MLILCYKLKSIKSATFWNMVPPDGSRFENPAGKRMAGGARWGPGRPKVPTRPSLPYPRIAPPRRFLEVHRGKLLMAVTCLIAWLGMHWQWRGESKTPSPRSRGHVKSHFHILCCSRNRQDVVIDTCATRRDEPCLRAGATAAARAEICSETRGDSCVASWYRGSVGDAGS